MPCACPKLFEESKESWCVYLLNNLLVSIAHLNALSAYTSVDPGASFNRASRAKNALVFIYLSLSAFAPPMEPNVSASLSTFLAVRAPTVILALDHVGLVSGVHPGMSRQRSPWYSISFGGVLRVRRATNRLAIARCAECECGICSTMALKAVHKLIN